MMLESGKLAAIYASAEPLPYSEWIVTIRKSLAYSVAIRSKCGISFLQGPHQVPQKFRIVECRGSIDEVIDQRLQIKVRTMADALNDTSLNVESIPYDIDFSTDDMNGDDVQAVIDYFFGDEK